jgi:hypothetical protein
VRKKFPFGPLGQDEKVFASHAEWLFAERTHAGMKGVLRSKRKCKSLDSRRKLKIENGIRAKLRIGDDVVHAIPIDR